MDALGNELSRLLVDTYRAAGKIEQIMLEDLSDGKLSLSEMRAIECVGGGRLKGRTVTQISQELDITLPSVTSMVKRLEQKGYA
ncbi:MAG: MarR family transcriptional regulator, partial [Clostridia bacterium]|nr:MarR family transcriptional regulator [Clostridia bacterium]